jgi:hypothetical protein
MRVRKTCTFQRENLHVEGEEEAPLNFQRENLCMVDYNCRPSTCSHAAIFPEQKPKFSFKL